MIIFTRKICHLSLVFLWALFPCIVFAETSIKGIFEKFTEIVGTAVPILMALVVVFFLLGIVRFTASSGNPEKRKEAKNLIIWGLVGIFFLVAFWGVIQILLQTVFGTGSPPPIPGNWPPKAFP